MEKEQTFVAGLPPRARRPVPPRWSIGAMASLGEVQARLPFAEGLPLTSRLESPRERGSTPEERAQLSYSPHVDPRLGCPQTTPRGGRWRAGLEPSRDSSGAGEARGLLGLVVSSAQKGGASRSLLILAQPVVCPHAPAVMAPSS